MVLNHKTDVYFNNFDTASLLSPTFRRKGGIVGLHSVRPSVSPSVSQSVSQSGKFVCPGHILKPIRGFKLKLHRWIYLIEEKYNAQEPLLSISYLWSYCRLLIFILQTCPAYISQTIRAMNLKLHRYIDLNREKCSAQEP